MIDLESGLIDNYIKTGKTYFCEIGNAINWQENAQKI